MHANDFPTLLSVDEARQRIVELCAGRRMPSQSVSLGEARTRVLAEDVRTARDLPPFANAAMDGFALRAADLPVANETRLRIIGTRLAGHAENAVIGPGECLRITTGAAMPAGADTVVIKERVRVEGDVLVVAAGEQAGSHVRPAGGDFSSGDLVVRGGQRITSARLAALASLGLAEVQVARRPSVSVITTGDELAMPGSECAAAQIFNSNGYSLAAMLEAAGIQPVQHGSADTPLPFRHVRDDQVSLRAALLNEAREVDVIITSGGVSAGEADFLPDLIGELGRLHFWKVRMRPGMPFLFGEIGRTLVFGLPGNPVSTIATFLCLVRPALAALQGCNDAIPRLVHAHLATPISKRHDRTEFLRARCEWRSDGSLWVSALAQQGSAMLRGIVDADALIVVPESSRILEVGEIVQVMPLPEVS